MRLKRQNLDEFKSHILCCVKCFVFCRKIFTLLHAITGILTHLFSVCMVRGTECTPNIMRSFRKIKYLFECCWLILIIYLEVCWHLNLEFKKFTSKLSHLFPFSHKLLFERCNSTYQRLENGDKPKYCKI